MARGVTWMGRSSNLAEEQDLCFINHRPNVSMDLWVQLEYQGPFIVDQMSLWIFWTGPNVPQGFI